MGVNPTRLRLILVAAVVGSLAWLVIPKIFNAIHWSSADPGEFVPVLVADHYIPAFTVIKPDWIRLQNFPKAFVPPGALHAKADLQNATGQMLFTSAIGIPEGHPVTRALIIDAAQSDTLGSQIRPGKVAVSFEIDKGHGVGGWIHPGDTVALFGLVPMDTNGEHPLRKRTRLLLSSVPVLAVDTQRLGQNLIKNVDGGAESSGPLDSPSSSDSKIVTVLVSPVEASLIIEAREEGSLSVVLRSLGDDLPWAPVN